MFVEHHTENTDHERRAGKPREEPLERRWKAAGEHICGPLHTTAAAFPSATFSWPQPAAMSCPLLIRSVAAMPCSCSSFVNASMRSTDGRRKSPAPGLYGIRFTCASLVGACRAIAAAKDRAVSTESFTPASRTYSKVTRRFVLFT